MKRLGRDKIYLDFKAEQAVFCLFKTFKIMFIQTFFFIPYFSIYFHINSLNRYTLRKAMPVKALTLLFSVLTKYLRMLSV